MELDALDKLGAKAFDGYLVRKDLVRTFSRQFPVPTYVVEFLLGRYCASTEQEEIDEGLEIVQRQLASRTVRAGEEELFKARAREDGSVKIMRQEAGADPSSKQRRAIDAQESFVAELRALKDEVERVAPLWNPNLDDGIIIHFAPLWRLVPHDKPWQRQCKAVWDKLQQGDYDWAHLAMHLWPERVVPKCAKDRSLAIAHGLEDQPCVPSGGIPE